MPIIEDILEAIKSGVVSEPFCAGDLARALRHKYWSQGSYATLLAGQAKRGRNETALFVRVSRGRYRLASSPIAQRRPPEGPPKTKKHLPTARAKNPSPGAL